MSKEVKYDISSVTGRLSARIANLEVQLAHESAAKDAYAARVQELEAKLPADEKTENAE